MITITLSNQKGGVAKTTTCLALSSGLSQRGYRVLAVDLDPQCNFCHASGIDPLNISCSLYDVFRKDTPAKQVLVRAPLGYDFLPGGLDLAGADMDFTQTGREFMLTEALDTLKDQYDYAILDTPPTLGILNVNALVASQQVIIPMTADAYSIQGLANLQRLIEQVRKYCNRDLAIAGLLLTKYNGRQTVSKAIGDMIEHAAEELGTHVFTTAIRESVAIREAALLQTDFLTEAPRANASIDYNGFIDEVIAGGN